MRFTDFLKATVLICAAAGTVLAAVTVAGASATGDALVVPVAAGWWVVAALVGGYLGRRVQATDGIARLLAGARTSTALPELHPGRTLVNRLWPLLAMTVVAGALAFLYPQVAAIAAGFAILGALGWRRQEGAVVAIEDRDGAAFYLERTSPFKPIALLRTPGFRRDLSELRDEVGAGGPRMG